MAHSGFEVGSCRNRPRNLIWHQGLPIWERHGPTSESWVSRDTKLGHGIATARSEAWCCEFGPGSNGRSCVERKRLIRLPFLTRLLVFRTEYHDETLFRHSKFLARTRVYCETAETS